MVQDILTLLIVFAVAITVIVNVARSVMVKKASGACSGCAMKKAGDAVCKTNHASTVD